MEQVRVLVANDHPIVRNGLRCLLEREPSLRVVGEAATGREAVMLAEHQHPDVAILDVKLSVVRCIDAARAIAQMKPQRHVLIVGALSDEVYVMEAFHAGAGGYVLSAAVDTDLVRAVLTLAGGGVFLSPNACDSVFDDAWRRGRVENGAFAERKKRLFEMLTETAGKNAS